VYSRPTKMIVKMKDKTRKIMYQNNGGQQENTLTMMQLLINEKIIDKYVDLLAKKIYPEYSIDVMKNYADDQNKGGSMKSCLLNHLIKDKVSRKFGAKYNINKSFIVLGGTLDQLNHENQTYLKQLNININPNNEYEMLKVNRGGNGFCDKMIEKIKKIYKKASMVFKLENKYDKMRLLATVIKMNILCIIFKQWHNPRL
jgi:hypothetical protein